jgi:hypothetical protein
MPHVFEMVDRIFTAVGKVWVTVNGNFNLTAAMDYAFVALTSHTGFGIKHSVLLNKDKLSK